MSNIVIELENKTCGFCPKLRGSTYNKPWCNYYSQKKKRHYLERNSNNCMDISRSYICLNEGRKARLFGSFIHKINCDHAECRFNKNKSCTTDGLYKGFNCHHYVKYIKPKQVSK